MASKFKYGDNVIVRSHKAKVISIFSLPYNQYEITVEFENKNLIPSKMMVLQHEVELNEEVEIEDYGKKCTCGIEKTYGKIHKDNHQQYCDLKRKKIKVDFNEAMEEMDKIESDFVKEFEKMLSDDDDDDDFGYF